MLYFLKYDFRVSSRITDLDDQKSKSDSLSKMETWFWILGWSLSTLAMAGNGFIIFLVFSRRQLRTKTNAFVVSLAMADFCVGMSVVPPIFFCEIASGCNTQSYWMTYLRLLFSYASVTTLCSLVMDRYIAVVKPLQYLTFMTRRRVIQMIFLSWGIQDHFGPSSRTVTSLEMSYQGA